MVCSEMVGFHELTLFMKVATFEEKQEFSSFLKNNDKESAVRLVGDVLGIKLTLDMLKKESPL